MPNVGPYIYDVSISGFTRNSIYIYDISSLRVNLNYYKFVVLDVHTLLFSILISTTGMIHLNNVHILVCYAVSTGKV